MTNVAPSMRGNVLRKIVVLVGIMYTEPVPDCPTSSAAYRFQTANGETVRNNF